MKIEVLWGNNFNFTEDICLAKENLALSKAFGRKLKDKRKVLNMGIADINRNNRKRQKLTELDKIRMEYECLEYALVHEPESYGDELELAQARYKELKEYFEKE